MKYIYICMPSFSSISACKNLWRGWAGDWRGRHGPGNGPCFPLGDWNLPTEQKRMATRSGILAWRIPWTEEPGGLQSDTVTLYFTSWIKRYRPSQREICERSQEVGMDMDPRCPVLWQDAASLAWPLSGHMMLRVQAFPGDHHLIHPFPVSPTEPCCPSHWPPQS